MRKTNYFKQLVGILETLKKEYPDDSIGRHLDLALADYPNLSMVSDRELVFAFEKYQAELALDLHTLVSEEYVKEIQEDAAHLFDNQPDEWENEET